MKTKHLLSWLLLPILIILLAVLLSKYENKTTSAQQVESLPTLILSDTQAIPSNLDQPFSLNLESGQEFDLYVYLYPEGRPLVAVDLEINFDPQVVEVLGKTESNLFPTYVEPAEGDYLDQEKGRINLGGVAFDLQAGQPTQAITQSGELSHFTLKVKENLGPQVTQITFDPSTVDPQNNLTTDTNLVSLSGENDSPQDVLGQVKSFKLIINQPGDINGDQKVDIFDFYFVSKNYGQTESFELIADINRDSRVDISDFYQISRNYGQSY